MPTVNTTKQKKKLFIEAFHSTLGNVSKACTAAGITRGTYYNWVGKGASPALDTAFVKALEDTEETRTDFVESQRLKLIQGYTLPETKVALVDVTRTEIVKGKPVMVTTKEWVEYKGVKHFGPDEKAINNYLNAKARKRGYGKEIEVKVSGLQGIKSIVFKEATVAPRVPGSDAAAAL